MISRFNRSVPVLFGPGSSLRTGLKVRELGCKKVLFLYDKGIEDAGIAGKLLENMKAAGVDAVCYNGVVPDPPDHMIHEAAELANREQVDGIVGLGGGSSMDAAKAVNVLTTNPLPINRYFDYSIVQKPGMPLVLVPTTAGTGSEATIMAVVSEPATNRKVSVLGPATIGTLAIVDPELMLGLPPQITAFTGMDAFSHAVEALTSNGMNLMSDTLAEKAISLITENLPLAVRDGSNLTARTNMAYASLIAGMAFSDTFVHLGHAIAHTIGAVFHIPHGVGCGLALPAVVEFVAEALPDKIRVIGKAMGLHIDRGMPAAEAGKAVAGAIRKLNCEIGLPGLKDYNIPKESLPQLIAGVKADSCSLFTPRQASAAQVYAMLASIYEH